MASLLLPIALATQANEGLYAAASSSVTSLTTLDAVPIGIGADRPFMLVEFYSSWCGHCQRFAPIYESIALETKQKIPRLVVAAVNCVDHEDICSAHSVRSYPTLKLYPGEVSHNGAMDAASVIAFVREHATAEQLEARPQQLPNTAGGGGVARANSSALQHVRWPGMQEAGNELAAAAKAYGIPDVTADDRMRPPLRPRPMPRPAPMADVLQAARYSLFHDIASALSSAPAQAYARKRLGALRAWLHALHHALPQSQDGGAMAVGAGELLAGLHARTDLPSNQEWMEMLNHAGFPEGTAGSGWVGCNSSRPELHAYPCSLWLLFHTLVTHSTEPEALPTLHAIVGYVTNFFGCSECAGHFAVLAARLEGDLRTLAAHKHRGGRERGALWLWKTHNAVNERLAAEALTDSPATEFAEFAKEQWPSRSTCSRCRELSGPPKAGVKPSLQWHEDSVYAHLLEQYCLEPRFECWDALLRLGLHHRKSHAEVSATYGAVGTGGAVCLLLLIACGCLGCRRTGAAICDDGSVLKPNRRKKQDHVV